MNIFKRALQKRKGKNLLIIEFVLAFIIVFCLSVFSLKHGKNYLKPIGFNHEEFIEIGLGILEQTTQDSLQDNKNEILQQAINVIIDQEEVVDYSLIKDFVPFGKKAKILSVNSGEIIKNAHNWIVDDNFKQSLEIQLTRGRWFNQEDNVGTKPIILNKDLSEELFPKQNPLGNTVTVEEIKYKVIGVVDHFYPNNSKNTKGFFTRNQLGTADFTPGVIILLKINTEINARTIVKFHELLGEIVNNKSNQVTYVNSLSFLRKRQWSDSLFFISSLSIVGLFLIINLLLGLISVLRLTINRRREEIGVRRAIGANKLKIYKLIISESFSLTLLGVLIGLVIVFQFLLFDVFSVEKMLYLIAILISIFILFFLVGLFSLFPASQATKIEPVVALHEE